jgi:hypothetical protein
VLIVELLLVVTTTDGVVIGIRCSKAMSSSSSL